MSDIPRIEDDVTPEKIYSEYQHHVLKRKGINVSKTKTYKNLSTKNYYVYFQKLAHICKNYNIDYSQYLSFIFENIESPFINPSMLLNIGNIRKYAEHIKMYEDYSKIYQSYMKTVNFIAKECHEHGFNSCIDYLKYLLVNKKFASYFAAGCLSRYWVISIPNIEKIINSLDTVEKETFSYIIDNKLKFYDDIHKAFNFKKSTMVKTITFTDKFIENHR